MEKINIQIETINQAFEYSPKMELARILHKIAHDLESGLNVNNNIMDINGNKVGFMEVEK